jgi:uncharacterized protein with von Willebrand factor type A (vWA) domain
MSTAQYEALTNKPGKSSKGKMLIQCLDRSGSMAGAPMEALR